MCTCTCVLSPEESTQVHSTIYDSGGSCRIGCWHSRIKDLCYHEVSYKATDGCKRFSMFSFCWWTRAAATTDFWATCTVGSRQVKQGSTSISHTHPQSDCETPGWNLWSAILSESCGIHVLTIEEMPMCLTQIEACLNFSDAADMSLL